MNIRFWKIQIGYIVSYGWDYYLDCKGDIPTHFIGIIWNNNLSLGLEWKGKDESSRWQ